jgi:LPS-assembly protein
VLENIIEFSGSQDDFFLDVSLESYETMNKPISDKYEFVYPNYSLKKIKFFEEKIVDNLEFISSGNQKKHSTNIYEAVQVNDFILNGTNQISKIGFNRNFKTIIKNVNSDGKNSSKFKDESQSEILSMITYDIDLPLIKDSNNFKNLLTPKMSLRFSPNDTKNLKDESRYLNTDNIFSLNRIGYSDTIESGTSLTLGLDFEKKRKENNDAFLSSKIGTVFRDELNENLPVTSTLGKKQSDFVGEINFIPNSNLEFDYNYSLKNDLNEINLHNFETTLLVNNFVNTFTFYEENNLLGDKSYYENEFAYNFNKKNSLSFKTRNNKKDNLTEFYNLIYQYKTDCLVASLRYNKEYYSNSTKKPNEELFFNITLIPLGSTQTESIID